MTQTWRKSGIIPSLSGGCVLGFYRIAKNRPRVGVVVSSSATLFVVEVLHAWRGKGERGADNVYCRFVALPMVSQSDLSSSGVSFGSPGFSMLIITAWS